MSLHITIFFKRKKRDLSNNWDVGAISSINQLAESVNSSVSSNAEVSSERFKSECIRILFNCC